MTEEEKYAQYKQEMQDFRMAEAIGQAEILAGEYGLGLGDMIARITQVFGVKAEDCSRCDKRRQALNKWRLTGWRIIKWEEVKDFGNSQT